MPAQLPASTRPRRSDRAEPHELDRLLHFSLAAIALLILLVLLLKQA